MKNFKIAAIFFVTAFASLMMNSCTNVCTKLPAQSITLTKDTVVGTVTRTSNIRLPLNLFEQNYSLQVLGFALNVAATSVRHSSSSAGSSDLFLAYDIADNAATASRFKPGQTLTVVTDSGDSIITRQPIYCHAGPLAVGQRVYLIGSYYGRKAFLPLRAQAPPAR